jgi:hypothetical protein
MKYNQSLYLIMANYIPLPQHKPLPEFSDDVNEYIQGLDERHKRLHEIAVKTLASSYFVERTHGFMNWKKKRNAATAAK